MTWIATWFDEPLTTYIFNTMSVNLVEEKLTADLSSIIGYASCNNITAFLYDLDEIH